MIDSIIAHMGLILLAFDVVVLLTALIRISRIRSKPSGAVVARLSGESPKSATLIVKDFHVGAQGVVTETEVNSLPETAYEADYHG